MVQDLSDIRCLPLSSLTIPTRKLLSTLLNSTKVLLTEGPIKLHRDWRGLASLVKLSSEEEATIWHYTDKTGKVLDLWAQSRVGLVGELLDHLATLDRFDVYDDIIDSIREQQTVSPVPANQVAIPSNKQLVPLVDLSEVLTFEDRPGYKHRYHAYMLYAEADQIFVMEMIRFLTGHGFEICTKENLLPGFATQYAPVAKLLIERCDCIITVYSPDFLNSRENTFYRDAAQAYSIELDKRMVLPIMYRMCELPPHVSLYHKLYYNSDNFWDRLAKSVESVKILSSHRSAPILPQPSPQSTSNSAVNIVTMPESNASMGSDSRYFLPPTRNNLQTSSNNLQTSSNNLQASSNNLQSSSNDLQLSSNVTQAPSAFLTNPDTEGILNPSLKKKKGGLMRRLKNTFTRKKNKKQKVQEIAQPICA